MNMKSTSFIFPKSFLFLFILQFVICGNSQANTVLSNSVKNNKTKVSYLKTPLSFEINKGQTNKEVKFLSRNKNHTLLLTSKEALISLSPGRTSKNKKSSIIKIKLIGGNQNSKILGLKELPGKVNYFIGNDSKKWERNIPTYEKVKYESVYPGIDLVYYGNQEKLEYDLVVAPGADPKQIAFKVEGAKKINLDKNGNLVLHTDDKKQVIQKKPFVYQEISGTKKEIAGKYILKANNEIGFQVANYDIKKPLIIDPVLVYSTYWGGNKSDEGFAVKADAFGNTYIVGQAWNGFPTTSGAFQDLVKGESDAFITKFSPSGTIIYSTLLGGQKPGYKFDNDDFAYDITVDAHGNAYVTGRTYCSDFPQTSVTYGITEQPRESSFVTKLNPSGSELVYSTCLYSYANAIALDAFGNAYITGIGLPRTEEPFVPNARWYGGGFGLLNASVIKLNTIGEIAYSVTFGGTSPGTHTRTAGYAISVDASGSAYVVGATSSTNFPVTSEAFQKSLKGDSDAFITKLAPDGKSIIYSTYLGGTGNENIGTDPLETHHFDIPFKYDVFVDNIGSAYIAGVTDSTDFPVTPGVLQPTKKGEFDVFVSKLNPTGSSLIFSTFLGGALDDTSNGLDVDPKGNIYLINYTKSTDFPVTSGALQTSLNANNVISNKSDVTITVLNPTATSLLYSTYFGGDSNEYRGGISIDISNNIYIAGSTLSMDIITQDPFQSNLGGTSDAFVAKISPVVPNPKGDIQKALNNLIQARKGFIRTNRSASATSKRILPLIQEIQKLVNAGGTDCEENLDFAIDDLSSMLDEVLDDIFEMICESSFGFDSRSLPLNSRNIAPSISKQCIKEEAANRFSDGVDIAIDEILNADEIDENEDSVPDICE